MTGGRESGNWAVKGGGGGTERIPGIGHANQNRTKFREFSFISGNPGGGRGGREIEEAPPPPTPPPCVAHGSSVFRGFVSIDGIPEAAFQRRNDLV